MTTRQVAEYLQVSPDTVLNLVKRGVLTPLTPVNPVLKRPRRFVFRAADVYALAMPHLDAAPRGELAEEPPGYDPRG